MGEASNRCLRILLVAHEFPPIPSPQALRWAYLVGELANRGHKVTVVTTTSSGYGPGGLPPVSDSVIVERVPVALWIRLLQGELPWRRRPSNNRADTALVQTAGSASREGPAEHRPGPIKRASTRVLASLRGQHSSRLNWRGQLAERLKAVCSRWIFPDYRGGWISVAAPRVRELLDAGEVDVVITSHEPACATLLVSRLRPFKTLWVADLGDPIMATYTPGHWKPQAYRLEATVCRDADLVTVTSEGTLALLRDRHGLSSERCLVITQGFSEGTRPIDEPTTSFDADRFELLYTGSFYSFRSPEALIAAVLTVPNARLTVASIRVPDALESAARQHPEKFRLIGFQRHDVTLSLQRSASVLISIGNADPVQVPGKIYEYLGSNRPILHIADANDGIAELLQLTGRGRRCGGTSTAIASTLDALRNEDPRGLPTGQEIDVRTFSWSNQAMRLESEILRRLQSKGS